MVVRFSTAFNRAYRKLADDRKDHVDAALRIFRQNPFDPRLHNHKLKGTKRETHALSVGYDLRILYLELDGHAVVLMINVGTHDQVY